MVNSNCEITFFLIFEGFCLTCNKYYSIGSWLYVYFEYVSQVGDPNDSKFTFMDPNYVFFFFVDNMWVWWAVRTSAILPTGTLCICLCTVVCWVTLFFLHLKPQDLIVNSPLRPAFTQFLANKLGEFGIRSRRQLLCDKFGYSHLPFAG